MFRCAVGVAVQLFPSHQRLRGANNAADRGAKQQRWVYGQTCLLVTPQLLQQQNKLKDTGMETGLEKVSYFGTTTSRCTTLDGGWSVCLPSQHRLLRQAALCPSLRVLPGFYLYFLCCISIFAPSPFASFSPFPPHLCLMSFLYLLLSFPFPSSLPFSLPFSFSHLFRSSLTFLSPFLPASLPLTYFSFTSPSPPPSLFLSASYRPAVSARSRTEASRRKADVICRTSSRSSSRRFVCGRCMLYASVTKRKGRESVSSTVPLRCRSRRWL